MYSSERNVIINAFLRFKTLTGFRFRHLVNQKMTPGQRSDAIFLVEVTGLEPAASTSRT